MAITPISRLLALWTIAGCCARTFTVQNLCSYTIYPALFTSSGPAPDDFGNAAASCSQQTLTLDPKWSGRLWGRTGCKADGSQCDSGTCAGGLVCTGTGATPVSLAEFTLDASGAQDFYDISLVDGFNLPMSITPTGSAAASACKQLSCSVNLLADCPAPLVQTDSTGQTVGCKSSCLANVDNNAADSPNCCSGAYDTPSTCPASGVQYYSYFKNACTDAYAYAYDDATSLFTCSNSTQPDYTITFCPGLGCSDGLAAPSGNGTITAVAATASMTASAGTTSSTVSPQSSSSSTTASKSRAIESINLGPLTGLGLPLIAFIMQSVT